MPAPDRQRRGRVVAETAVVSQHVQGGPDWWHLTLRAPAISRSAFPGQFVQVRVQPLRAPAPVYDPLLARPLSLCTLDPERGELSVIYRVVGRGTALLASMAPGSTVELLGPLGRSFPDPSTGRGPLFLIGGGLGIPPLAAAAAWARTRGPVALLGARQGADLAGADQVAAAGASVELCTEDGSRGATGLVTDLLRERLVAGGEVWACGPHPMLAAVAEASAEAGAPAWLALERPMACGFGVCMGCAVRAPDGTYLRACTEGPVFPSAAVDWGEGGA